LKVEDAGTINEGEERSSCKCVLEH